MNAPTTDLRSHPCYQRAVRIYRNAMKDWARMPSIRAAADTLGIDHRGYCDARITANQFQWYSSGTGEEFTREHLDCAWRDARAAEMGAGRGSGGGRSNPT